MRVLLAGMQQPDNQFVRAIKSYGCDVIHTDPDPGKFPLHADAVVMVKCQLSHQKFWDVKEAYKGKPVLICDRGFSEVKERFEALIKKSEVQLTLVGDGENSMTKARTKNSKETMAKITRVIYECMKAEMSNKEIVEMLGHEGLLKATGEPYTPNEVSMIKSKLRHSLEVSKQNTLETMAPLSSIKVLQPTEPEPEPVKEPEPDPFAMIDQVLATTLPATEAMALIQKIRTGELKSFISNESYMDGGNLVLKRHDLLGESNVDLRLNRFAVQLILENLDMARRFLDINTSVEP